MSYKVTEESIENIRADAIVIPTSCEPICAPGIEMEVFQKAGIDEMIKARGTEGKKEHGDVFVTSGYALKCKHIIHVVRPNTNGVSIDIACEKLRACYRSAFERAMELKCTSIAVPVLMRDVYGFDQGKAMDVAADEITRLQNKYSIEMILSVPPRNEFEFPEQIIIESLNTAGMSVISNVNDTNSLEEELNSPAENFGQKLFRLIDEKKLKDSEVYRRAGVDRRVISKLRLNTNKNVSKETALSLAIGLELTLDETKDFIALAGWALSMSNPFDRIVAFYLKQGNYDIKEINEKLYSHTGMTLGIAY